MVKLKGLFGQLMYTEVTKAPFADLLNAAGICNFDREL